MTSITDLIPKKDLQTTLQSLRHYRKMYRQIGARTNLYFWVNPETNYRVEFDPKMSKELIEQFSLQAFQNYFTKTLETSQIGFTPNPSLISGVRLFVWDDMVDISYKDVENTLKQL